MKSLIRMLCLAVLITTAGQLQAGYIVNTGTPTISNLYTFAPSQYFAGEFSTNDAYTLNSIEGFLANPFGSGNGIVDLAIHSDSGNVPGGILFSTTFALGAGAKLDWYGASNLGWDLTPGTFWVSFKPSNAVFGFMPGKAPNPLDEYAFAGGNYDWHDLGPNAIDYIALGFRIDASPIAAVPEPASIAIWGIGALGCCFVARRKKKLA